MNNLLTKIVTPEFITFNAHAFFAAFVVLVCSLRWPAQMWHIAMIATVVAAFKEFYIDKHFEVGQTFNDNMQDWMGYNAGITLGLLAKVFA